MPNADERALKLRELGQALLANSGSGSGSGSDSDSFDGLAGNMVKQAGGSAVLLVKLILQHLPGFRDACVYKGRLVHLYKRAQILVADVWAAYGRKTAPSKEGDFYYFTDIGALTMFADYRVPQLLRVLDIMKYVG